MRTVTIQAILPVDKILEVGEELPSPKPLKHFICYMAYLVMIWIG